MTYAPYPSVVINGITYGSEVIEDISITKGRPDITQQPDAGTARVILWTPSDAALPIQLGQIIEIQIQDSTGTLKPIYHGIISDIAISLDAYGNSGSIAFYSLTCVGIQAQLNRRLAGATGFSKELEGVRILNILTEALLTNWTDVSSTLTWQQLPQDVSWASYDGTAIDTITNLTSNIDAGQFELMAYSSGEANALDLLTTAAQSGRGVIYEKGNGDLVYDDYAARSSFTTLTLTAADLLANGMQTAAQWSEVINDVTVTYRAGSENSRDEQSIILYGQLAATRDTQLHNQADALAQATAFMQSRAYPRTYPETLTVALHNPETGNTTRDALVDVYCGLPITTSALPAVFGTNFTGYVEGWTWKITRMEAFLEMTMSAQSETYPHTIWYQVPSMTTWSGYTSTTKWSDL